MMKQGKAITKFLRISPQKARYAADLVRGLPVEEAMAQLQFSSLKAGIMLGKTLKSAVVNAEVQNHVRRENLKVVEVRIDEGPRLKRGKSRSKGSRVPVLKRMSHFTVVVGTD